MCKALGSVPSTAYSILIRARLWVQSPVLHVQFSFKVCIQVNGLLFFCIYVYVFMYFEARSHYGLGLMAILLL